MSLLLLANQKGERKKKDQDLQKVTSPYYFILPLFMPNPVQLYIYRYICT